MHLRLVKSRSFHEIMKIGPVFETIAKSGAGKIRQISSAFKKQKKTDLLLLAGNLLCHIKKTPEISTGSEISTTKNVAFSIWLNFSCYHNFQGHGVWL